MIEISDAKYVSNGGKVYYRKNKEKREKSTDNLYNQGITERTYFVVAFQNCHFIIEIEIRKVLLNLGFEEHSVLLDNHGDNF